MTARVRISLLVFVALGLTAALAIAHHRAGAQGKPAASTPPPATTAAVPAPLLQAAIDDAPGRRRYLAPHPGVLPKTGRPTIAGIRLPYGRRSNHTDAWETTQYIPNAVDLAAKLADAFPTTGLWPVLWSDGDEPTNYMDANPDDRSLEVRTIPTVNVKQLLRHLWDSEAKSGPPFSRPFGDLARASHPRSFRNPFSILAAQQLQSAGPSSSQLLLIPCRRPADTPTTVILALGDVANASVSAVLRSWEPRFGATVVQFGFGGLTLAVNAPPRDRADIARLSHEYFALPLLETEDPDAREQLLYSLNHHTRIWNIDFEG